MMLALAARELVRVCRMCAVETHALEQTRDLILALLAPRQVVDAHGFADDVADGHARVETSERVLEDDLHALAVLAHLALGELGDVDAVEVHLARRGLDEAQDRAADGRLPEPDRLPGRRPRPLDVEADVLNGLNVGDHAEKMPPRMGSTCGGS